MKISRENRGIGNTDMTRRYGVFITVFIFIIGIFSGCSAQRVSTIPDDANNSLSNKPAWVRAAKHSDYPAPRYIAGVGLAKSGGNPAADRQSADHSAFSEIARQIFAQVSSETSVEQMEITGDKVETIIGRTIANSKIRSSLTVSGLTIVDRFYDPSERTYYSL